MSNLFAIIPNIGELYYYHTYLYYDGPQIFSCITNTKQYYFLATIPSDESEEAWLAVPISSGKLVQLEKNALEIREAFINPESILWKIDFIDNKFVSNIFLPISLTDDLLPEKGELLDYADAQELSPPVDAPIEISRTEMRDVIEVSLEKDDQHITELPCSVLSDVLSDIQQLVFALGYKDGGLSGPIPRKVKEDNTLCITGMFAASVGIRLKSNELSDIFGKTPLSDTLSELNSLFSCMDDRQALRDYISVHSPRVAVKYRTLLKNLVKNKTGIRINNASPNDNSFNKHFSTKQLAVNLEYINSEIEEMVESKTFYGKLVGINVERDSFEFISTDDERIRGGISDALKGQVFSVPQVVEAHIEIRIGMDAFTREEKLIYSLLAINPVIDE